MLTKTQRELKTTKIWSISPPYTPSTYEDGFIGYSKIAKSNSSLLQNLMKISLHLPSVRPQMGNYLLPIVSPIYTSPNPSQSHIRLESSWAAHCQPWLVISIL